MHFIRVKCWSSTGFVLLGVSLKPQNKTARTAKPNSVTYQYSKIPWPKICHKLLSFANSEKKVQVVRRSVKRI